MQRHEYVLGSNAFFIARYPPFVALEILGDLQQRFAAPMLEAMGKPDSKPATLDSNPLMAAQHDQPQSAGEQDMLGVILRGFGKVSASMNGRELKALTVRLLGMEGNGTSEYVTVSVDGREVVKLSPQIVAVSGMTSADIIALCVEVVKVNYSDFISRFAGRIGEAKTLLRQSPSDDSVTH